SRKLGAHPVLDFGFALLNDDWKDVQGGAIFRIDAEDLASHTKDNIFSARLLSENVRDKEWLEDQEIDLAKYANRNVRFIFETFPTRDSKSVIAGWVNPTLIENSGPRKKFNVILVSFD